MSIFFTADQHFGHTNIIKHCNRPFDNTFQMQETLIERFNSKVGEKDTTYHLGDFFYRGNRNSLIPIIERLKGYHYFLLGNHDKDLKKLAHLSEGILIKGKAQLLPDPNFYELNYHKKTFVLCHYPLRTWARRNRGTYHLFGHVHGNLKDPTPGSMDVGVDAQDFSPVSIEEIVPILDEQIKAQKSLSNL